MSQIDYTTNLTPIVQNVYVLSGDVGNLSSEVVGFEGLDNSRIDQLSSGKMNMVLSSDQGEIIIQSQTGDQQASGVYLSSVGGKGSTWTTIPVDTTIYLSQQGSGAWLPAFSLLMEPKKRVIFNIQMKAMFAGADPFRGISYIAQTTLSGDNYPFIGNYCTSFWEYSNLKWFIIPIYYQFGAFWTDSPLIPFAGCGFAQAFMNTIDYVSAPRSVGWEPLSNEQEFARLNTCIFNHYDSSIPFEFGVMGTWSPDSILVQGTITIEN